MVAVSGLLSASAETVTVNVCGLSQAWEGVLALKLRFDGDTATSALLLEAATLTALQPVNGLSSTTVYVPRFRFVPPPKVGSSCSAMLSRLSVIPGVGETASVAEVRSVLPECAAASTRTASVDAVLKP